MDEPRSKRKLTAILSADVKGYSRLMRQDEQATVRTLEAHRQTISQTIEKYRGRVVDSPGDNLLAEFASVVDAVEAAAEIQKRLALKNADLPEERRMQFRIGINLGDVIAQGERIYGDGVNVAARVESLAEAGGVAVSQSAFEQIKRKTRLGFQSLGEHQVKNIDEPIKVYRVLPDPGDEGKLLDDKSPLISRRTFAVALLFAVAALVATLIVQQYFHRMIDSTSDPNQPQTLALPEKPSIAVLPLANLTGNPQDTVIGDGISIGVTMALSQNSKLFVIDRGSCFTFKSKNIKASQVAKNLGVRYVLEGDVQRQGDMLRINARLVDTAQGRLLWSEYFNRKPDDILSLQDEITLKVASALLIKLSEGEQTKLFFASTKNLKAWSKMVQAVVLFQNYTKEKNAKARELLQEAIEIDPDFVSALIFLAWTYYIDARFRFCPNPRAAIEKAIELARKATDLDPSMPQLWAFWGTIYIMQRRYNEALKAGAKSVELGPSMAINHILYSQTLLYTGRLDQAIKHTQLAMRLYPTFPAWQHWHLGSCFFQAGRYQEAMKQYKKALARAKKGEFQPGPPLMRMAATYAVMGQEDKARQTAKKALEFMPGFTLSYLRETHYYQDPARIERVVSALRKAGIPE
jgi:adenylate cyclase